MPASMCVSPLARVDAPGKRSKGKEYLHRNVLLSPQGSIVGFRSTWALLAGRVLAARR